MYDGIVDKVGFFGAFGLYADGIIEFVDLTNEVCVFNETEVGFHRVGAFYPDGFGYGVVGIAVGGIAGKVVHHFFQGLFLVELIAHDDVFVDDVCV